MTVTDARARLEQQKTPNGYYNIIDELLRADLPVYEKENHRLALEAQGLIATATETTAWTLSLATFHIYHDREIMRKLRIELLNEAPDKRAIITEAFGHAGGPLSRLPRIFPIDATVLRSTYNGKLVEYTVLPGTVLSMSSTYIYNNPELFHDPHAFLPERWLDEHGKRRRDMEKYLLHFSKSTKGRVGLNLATAELYMCLAALILQVGEHVDLYKTDLRDVAPEFDNFAMRPYKRS